MSETGRVVSQTGLAFMRGRKAFLEGKPSPPKPDDENDCTSPEAAEWIGWTVERGLRQMRRREEREYRMLLRRWAKGEGPLPKPPRAVTGAGFRPSRP